MDESDSDKESDFKDTDSSASKKDEFELCRICKTDVPKAYIPEHVESIIHKTNMKIIKVALDRSKEHLDNYKKWRPCIIQPTEEFCEACNEVYDYLDFAKHAETERHRKLIVYQKILPRMYQLYKDTIKNLHVVEEIDSIFKKYESQTSEKVIDKEGKTYCEVCDVYKQTNGFNGHLRGKRHKNNCLKKNIPVSNIRKQPKEETYCEICHVFKSSDAFDAHLNSKKHQQKLRKLNKKDDPINEVEEEDEQNNDILNIDKLTEGHEMYITDTEVSQIKRCKICQARLQDDEEIIKEHVKTVEHLLAYKDILINYNIAKVDKEYFCVDCEVFFTDLIKHKIEKHIKTGVGLHQEYCELCKVIVPCSSKSTHYNGAKHIKNESKRRKENITFIEIELGDDIDKESLSLTIIDKKLACSVCKISLDDKRVLVNHFKDVGHSNGVNYYARTNCMNSINEIFHCRICNHSVERNDVYRHVKFSNHRWRQFD